MKYIAPSILSADFSRLGEELKAVEIAGADLIHIDVMDGHFVPNITMGPLVVEAAKKATPLPLDVHLMIDNPDQFVHVFADAGADWISVHAETCIHLHRTIQVIKDRNRKAGVVLNPATPLHLIEWVLADVDFVLIMSVNPGFGGQNFISASLEKIRDLRKMIQARNLSTLIQIDGGVNSQTIKSIAEAGVDVFVAGSAIFGSEDYHKTIEDFKRKIKSAEKDLR